MRFCHATTRWHRSGFEEMDDFLRAGKPVLAVVWHERIWMSTYMFNTDLGRICALTTKSQIAHVGHLMLESFDFEAEMIDPKRNPIAINRRVLRRIRDGCSIAFAPDGTRGPSRVCKPYPVKWVRQTQVPVFCVTFSMRRTLRLPTWDRAHVPLPFNRGALLARKWTQTVPADADESQLEALTRDLGAALNAVTTEADRIVGRRVHAEDTCAPSDQDGETAP
jgi:lysophospholipid acyltransferase (LPLAT)-like uncharacterized protein